MTGYEIDKGFNDSLNFFWQANTSQIYRELNKLEEVGLLKSEWILQSDKPNKRIYSITEEGKKELDKWLYDMESSIDGTLIMKSSFLMRIFFAGEINPEKAIDTIKVFKKKCAERKVLMNMARSAIEAYQHEIDNAEKAEYWKLTVLFGDEFFTAGLIWADKALEILENINNKEK